MTAGEVRARVLGDLAEGPKAASVFAAEIGPYAYPCLYKLQADGLVRQDVRTLAYELTDAGRARLGTGASDEEGTENDRERVEEEREMGRKHQMRDGFKEEFGNAAPPRDAGPREAGAWGLWALCYRMTVERARRGLSGFRGVAVPLTLLAREWSRACGGGITMDDARQMMSRHPEHFRQVSEAGCEWVQAMLDGEPLTPERLSARPGGPGREELERRVQDATVLCEKMRQVLDGEIRIYRREERCRRGASGAPSGATFAWRYSAPGTAGTGPY